MCGPEGGLKVGSSLWNLRLLTLEGQGQRRARAVTDQFPIAAEVTAHLVV